MKKNIVIIGGGIAGLAAAYYLRKHDLTLIEKTSRLGGWIQSSIEQGFLFEGGPRGFRAAGSDHPTLNLVNELGLHPLPAHPQASRRYLASKGRLQLVSLPWMLRSGLLWAGCKDLLQRKSHRDNETIASFFSRHLGNRFTKKIIDPLTRGIFGGDMNVLSARSCFPSLWQIDHHTGSFIRGRPRTSKPILYSFQGGMHTLIEALSRTPMTLRLNTSVLKLEAHRVILENEIISADHIIIAVPPHQFPQLISLPDPHQYATISCVHFGWHKAVLKHKGYGFLVPSYEPEKIMGMTFDSNVFPDQLGKTRLSVMINGTASRDVLIDHAKQAIERFCNITAPADVTSLVTAKQAIAQYGLDHASWLRYIEDHLPPGIHAIGSGLRGVGVNDCIADAKRLSLQL